MKIRLSKTPSRRASVATETDLLGEGAARTVNLLRSGGRFAPAVHAVPSDFPDCPPGASAAYYSQGSGALFVLVGDSAYRLEKGGSEYSKLADLNTAAPFFVDMCVSGSPATVLVDGSDAIVCNGAGADAAECPHAFFAGTEHCGRFFGRDLTDGHVVRWAASHVLDWEEGIDGCGYARLPSAGGDVLGLFGFRDRLVAVRERGVTVICDRFTDSTLAYQGYARGLGAETVEELGRIACGGLSPDLTIFLDLDPEAAFSRKGGADKGDRLEMEGLAFHRRVYEGYKRIAEKYPERVVCVPAGEDALSVHAKVMRALEERGVI